MLYPLQSLILRTSQELSLPPSLVKEAVYSQFAFLASYLNHPLYFAYRMPFLGSVHIRPQRVYPLLFSFVKVMRRTPYPKVVQSFRSLYSVRHILLSKSRKKIYYGF